MIRILGFDAFSNISEKIQYITANWYAISDEASFEKKEGSGYFLFNQGGIFSILYSKPNNEEARIDFYISKESSPDSKSLCSCKIIDGKGEVTENKKFQDISKENIWDMLSLFFDYCDLENVEKEVIDRFLLGFSKSLKVIFAHDSKDKLPSSFKSFSKLIEETCKQSTDLKDSELDYQHKILKILKSFIKFYNKSI